MRPPTDAGLAVGSAAKRCYNSFEEGHNPNVTRVRRDWVEYLENILKQAHGSVLEHATFTFAIEGVTRVFTAEMNRHRAGVAISEASMRYIRFDDIPYWVPVSLQPGGEFHELDPNKARETLGIFDYMFAEAESSYKELCDIWDIEQITDFGLKKRLTSMFRRIVPMGVSTGGKWTVNFRAVRHILALRSSPHAEEEIAYVWTKIGKRMVEEEPHLLGDFEQVNGFWVPKYPKV